MLVQFVNFTKIMFANMGEQKKDAALLSWRFLLGIEPPKAPDPWSMLDHALQCSFYLINNLRIDYSRFFF